MKGVIESRKGGVAGLPPDRDPWNPDDVIREESRRRRPVDTDVERLQRQRADQIRELLRLGDRAGMLWAIRDYGFEPGSREYEQIARLVRELLL